jgi:hypothetical protein
MKANIYDKLPSRSLPQSIASFSEIGTRVSNQSRIEAQEFGNVLSASPVVQRLVAVLNDDHPEMGDLVRINESKDIEAIS